MRAKQAIPAKCHWILNYETYFKVTNPSLSDCLIKSKTILHKSWELFEQSITVDTC